ncbi:MAG: DUF6785 family protein [Armatimonadia bacterium]
MTAAATSRAPSAPAHGFTLRAILIALLLVVGFTIAGSISVMARYEILGTGYLPRGVMALLLIVVVLNILARKVGLRALTQRELLVIFMLLAIMAAIPGQEFAQHFYLNNLGLVYYATPEIAPPEIYLDDLNPLLVPSLDRDAPVIKWAYEGLPASQSIPWRPWVVPLLVWTPYFFALYGMLLCFAALLSRRWEQQERLLYPLIQVPMELTEGEPHTPPLLRDWLLWAAFGVALIPFLTKGLHSYFPMVPDLNLQKDSGQLFGGGPLVAFNGMPLHYHPEMMGISYLLSSEVAFSLWFFYLMRLAQTAFRIGIGLNTNHGQFAEMETVGGYLVLALALLWSARRYLQDIITSILQPSQPSHPAASLRRPASSLGHPAPPLCHPEERSDEGSPERARPAERLGFWGLLICFGFILWWSRQIGLAVGWASLLMGIFPLVSMVASRVVCEAGMFIYASPFRLDHTLFRLIGVKTIGPANLTLMTMMSWTQIRSTATQFMPQAFQCFKLGTLIEAPRKRTVAYLGVAVAIALLVCHIMIPLMIYKYGVFRLGWWPQGSGLGTTNLLMSDLRGAVKPSAEDFIALALGGGFTWFLVFMRQRFLWWPFHPLGYIAWLGWPTERYWLSIFFGWIIKIIVVRFGGYKAFQRLKPAAYGLILGVTFIVSFWIVFHFFVPGAELIRE